MEDQEELDRQKECDILIDKIKNRDISFIEALQELSEFGFCPNLLNDDNGHWAVVYDGFQTLAYGDEPCDVQSSFYVEKKFWKDNIYDALIVSFEEEDLEFSDDKVEWKEIMRKKVK